MKPSWIDSHAHLSMVAPEEAVAVLERAAAVGVDRVLVPATGAGDLDATVRLAREHGDRVVAAVGVHPHEASSLDGRLRRRLEAAVSAPGVVAVGEIGLDYHYLHSPREDQLRALEWQLDLASRAGLPVVLHNRESFADLVAVLAARAGGVRGVCHSFSDGAEAARRVVELGLYVGISGMVTFRRADEIRAAARAVPTARLLLETDSPYLAPEPHRGRPNEPSMLPHVARRVALERASREPELALATSDNFAALFGVPTSATSAAARADGGRS